MQLTSKTTFSVSKEGSLCYIALLTTCFMLVSPLAYSSTLTVEEISSSETMADFQQTTWPYIAEDITLRNTMYFSLHLVYVAERT
jgi:hypothetical protein